MKLENAIKEYISGIKKARYIHAHITNSCYDHCAHCYMIAVPECSPKAKYVDKKDLLHLIDLMQNEKEKLELGLSGGEPLLHPDIAEILDYASKKARVEVLTSGFALSTKNKEQRKELLEALVRNNACLTVASPDEPYHSITWDDIGEIRTFVKEQGHSPNKIGYPSRKKEILFETAAYVFPPMWIIGPVKYILKRLGKTSYPPVIPIGRGKNLPKEQQKTGVTNCPIKNRNDGIYVNYEGKLQYCLYSVHDGFMNISELKEAKTKEEALGIIAQRLSEDITFKDMAEHERCYFSKKIRKK